MKNRSIFLKVEPKLLIVSVVFLAPLTGQAFGDATPPPVISSLSPTSAHRYGPPFTLTVNGTGFLSGATVDWNGTPLPTTFVSGTQLTAAVADISVLFPQEESSGITVVNPGNVSSSVFGFTVFWPLPVITSLSPSSATAGDPAFTLTINGGEFLPNSSLTPPTLLWNNTYLSINIPISDTQLTATVPASLIAVAGSASIVVSTVLGGGSSNAATFTINPGASAPSGSLFIPVSPCRLVDTRDAAGPFGAPFVPADGTRSFPIPSSSSCSIPGTALAYSLNLTVVPHGTLGYATLWPTGQVQPVVSTLNSLDGRVKANASIVSAGTNGAVSVFATNNTDVILDITGYFISASDPSAEAFYPITPCRLVDTRGVSPSVSTGAVIGGTSRTLPLLSSSCNVPGTATAYSLNFTAIPANGILGYLTVYPTGAAQPVVSTLNAPTGTIVANAAIVPAGTAGSIDVYATDTTDLVVDINGYFAAPGTGGLSFYPVSPCRVLDSRNPLGTPPFMGLINVNVIGSGCASVSTAQAYAFNATVVPPAPLGYLTLGPEGGAQPVVSTLNALDGSITSNMAIVPASNNAISAYAANNTYLILDMSGYFAP